ncbi:MAG: hypothetical protein MZV70_50690 [Desulfobacterales bacterium]|nr:hypothetical protein [Desulfobacterales bacterium]
MFPHHENENAIAAGPRGQAARQLLDSSGTGARQRPRPCRASGDGVFRPRDPLLADVDPLPPARRRFGRAAGRCAAQLAAAGPLRPGAAAGRPGAALPRAGPADLRHPAGRSPRHAMTTSICRPSSPPSSTP